MKKKFLIPISCVATSVAALTPLSALSSCGSIYDNLAYELYKSAITEFVGSEVAATIFKDKIDENVAGITSIARPSGNLDGIRQYLYDTLQALGISRDQIHENTDLSQEEQKYRSMWFDIPASSDGTNLPKVILQAHMDMIFAWDEEAFHETYPGRDDPIATKWTPDAVYSASTNSIHTRGYSTSLGSDNGIGMAIMLAILAHKDKPGFKHGPIRCIITADEEEGMKGAKALVCGHQAGDDMELLDNEILAGIIDSPYLINIDNETVGDIVTSCAGGIGSHYKQNFIVRSSQPDDVETYNQYKISISGLKGGHSGVDINNWHANAIKMAAQIMDYCDTRGIGLIDIKTPGVEAYNSIPSKCEFTFAAPISLTQVEDACIYTKTTACRIYQGENINDVKIDITEIPDAKKYPNSIDATESRAIYLLIEKLLYGPFSWIDPEMKIVKTSANVGPAQLTVNQDITARGKYQGAFTLSTYSRSLETSDVEYFKYQDAIYSHFYLGDNVNYDESDIGEDTYTIDTVYPGWEKGDGSEKLHDLAVKGFKTFGIKAKDADIHGGVEPAWWSDVYTALTEDDEYREAYKDWAVTSIGPTLKFCHNPKEECYLDTVSITIKTILYMLDHIAD